MYIRACLTTQELQLNKLFSSLSLQNNTATKLMNKIQNDVEFINTVEFCEIGKI